MFIEIKKLIWFTLFASSTVLGQVSPLSKQDTCTPSSAGDPSVDDVPAISKALSTCGSGGTIVIPAGKTSMIRSPLDFSNCNACEFQIEGTLKASDDLAYWERKATILWLSNVAGATIRSLTGSETISRLKTLLALDHTAYLSEALDYRLGYLEGEGEKRCF